MIKNAIRFLWSIQPRKMRRFELDVLELCLTQALPENRPTPRGDIVVCGFLGTASGIGQGARQMLHFFEEMNLPVWGANASRFAILEDFEGGPLWPAQASAGGIVIFHINPDIMSLVWRAIGRKHLISRYSVGVWAWELDVPPERWRRAVNLVDEIWAPSTFVAQALSKIAGGKPIHVLPHYLDVASFRSQPAHDPLPALQGKTVVFFSYDVRSLHARKNPEAVVEAFRLAAANNPQAALVIKINNNGTWPEARARVECAAEGLSNVIIMEDKLSDDGMRDLLARADIVMSLHRSEGFGLLMAEGMAASKPVIATGWSGNLDFMTPSCSVLIDYTLVPVEDPQHIYDKYGALWAEPDIAQAGAALKRLIEDPAERQRLGQAARAQAEAFFSKEAWIKLLPSSLAGALEKRPRSSTEAP